MPVEQRQWSRSACRNWPQTISPASFKTVPFEVDEDTRSGGRRVAIHEYPDREGWDNEDLGRLHERVRVNGYVYGDEADKWATDLFEACASAGPGTLWLPTRQPAQARCLEVHSSFQSDAMGRIPFEMEFVLEAPFRGGLVSTVMLVGTVLNATLAGISALAALFGREFDTLMRRFSPMSPVPAVARDAAAETIRLAAAALNAARLSIRFKNGTAAGRAELAIRDIAENATAMAYQGARSDRIEDRMFVSDAETANRSGFAPALTRALKLMQDGAADGGELAAAMTTLTTFQPQQIYMQVACLSVRAERTLTEDVAALVRRMAVLTMAAAITRTSYASRGEAQASRDLIAVAFAGQIAGLTDPATESALRASRDAAVSYLSRVGAELPETILVESGRSMPAAVLATVLYNDATRDAELVMRNRAPHALHMPLKIEALRP